MNLRLPRLRSLSVPLENESQRLNYVNSTIEGCLAVTAIQVVASFVIVYAMELGASNSQVGLLVSIPFLANSLMILAGGRIIAGRSSILQPTCIASAMHRVFIIFMIPAPLLPQNMRVWWVLATYSMASAAAAVAATWWTAMVSDLFPREHRGAVFGTRAMFTGGAGVLATLLAGQALDIMPFPYNFMIVFFLAAVAGFLAIRYLALMQLPKDVSRDDVTNERDDRPKRPRWRDVLQGETGKAFARLALPVFLFNLGFHLAAPVMSIYFVEYLSLSKGRIGLLTSIFLICQVLSSRFWGRMGDRYGNHFIAFLAMLILVIQAIFYIAVPSMPFLLIMQAMGGLAFGGYAMSTFNAIIGLGASWQRSVLVSLFNVVAGLGGFLSPTMGTAVLGQFGLLAAFLTAAALRCSGMALMGYSARHERRQVHEPYPMSHRTTTSSSTTAASPSE